MGHPFKILPRALEPALRDRLERFPVVVLSGARQTGKTTLVRRFEGAFQRRYTSLDSIAQLDQARNDPDSLLRPADRAITIDEVQRAPELLRAIKLAVDKHPEPGRFLLTGSANLLLLESVGESLAGRACYLCLRPLTEREKRGDPAPALWAKLVACAGVEEAIASIPAARPIDWRRAALEGGYPPAALAPTPIDRALWLEAYVDAYVQRDLRDLTRIGDLAGFLRLVKLAFSRNGGILNQSSLARDAGLSRTTAQRWLSVLSASLLVTHLESFHPSRPRRVVKSPKLYAVDTGLAAWITGIEDEAALERHATSGAWLENLVLNDLLAWRETELRKPDVHYWRLVSGQEIDFIVERGRRLLPIEVKTGRNPHRRDARHIDDFCSSFDGRVPFGLVLHGGEEVFALSSRCLALPFACVL